jgi:hypothetical protein
MIAQVENYANDQEMTLPIVLIRVYNSPNKQVDAFCPEKDDRIRSQMGAWSPCRRPFCRYSRDVDDLTSNLDSETVPWRFDISIGRGNCLTENSLNFQGAGFCILYGSKLIQKSGQVGRGNHVNFPLALSILSIFSNISAMYRNF